MATYPGAQLTRHTASASAKVARTPGAQAVHSDTRPPLEKKPAAHSTHSIPPGRASFSSRWLPTGHFVSSGGSHDRHASEFAFIHVHVPAKMLMSAEINAKPSRAHAAPCRLRASVDPAMDGMEQTHGPQSWRGRGQSCERTGELEDGQ